MAISIEQIKELREATGAGVLDAKKALESSGGDFEAAMGILREKGLAKAAKRADRETTEGRIEARFEGTRVGLLLEVNCETDFVGSNDNFVAFSEEMADHFFAATQEGQPLDEVMALPLVSNSDSTPADRLQDLITSTGENMQIRRFERYELGDRPGIIEVYMHPGNRVAVMLELNSKTAAGATEEAFVTLAHDVALHIAALAPVVATRDLIPADTLEAEKASYRKQALDEGKPEAIVERIIEGRLRKYYEGVVLMEQAFVKDDEVKIEKLFNQISKQLGEEITLRRFARFELGEPLD